MIIQKNTRNLQLNKEQSYFAALTENYRTIKIIHFLSSGSFALYLCHPPILQISNTIFIKLGLGNGTKLLLLLFSTILGSYSFYYLIDRPLEKKFKNYIFKKPVT